MDEFSTPINQIRPDINEKNNTNYSDMLQNIEHQNNNQPQEQQNQMNYPPQEQQNQMNYPPPPIVQSKNELFEQQNNYTNLHNQILEKPLHNIKDDNIQQTHISAMQKDFLYLVIPSIILYSTSIQNYLIRSIPSLFKEEKPTIIGNVINASIVAFIFITLKNMKIHFN